MIIKKIDYYYSQRANHYIAMTSETADRIRIAYNYNGEIPLINPSINTNKYFVSKNISDYYLIVSRLEKYKKIDLVIQTFNKLKLKLKIVGDGMEKENLQKIAKSNIEFIDRVDDGTLSKLYSNCKALIFPQHEDYGLTPLEANASGRPVIAYNKGGIESTMIPYDKSNPNFLFTALLFKEVNVDSLASAVIKLNQLSINPSFIRKHAEKFDDKCFVYSIKKIVNEKFGEFQK